MSIETISAALFSRLVGSVVARFTGDTHGSTLIDNISSAAGLFVGLPVFGAGIPGQTVITAFDPAALTITLSQPATASVTGASLATGFQTTGRRVLSWTATSYPFPAMFLRNIASVDDWPQTTLNKVTLEMEVWLYTNAGANPDISPAILLNNLVQAVRNSFRVDAPQLNQFTLGGLVQSCRIEGRSDFDPGDLDGIGKAVLPVKILAMGSARI